MIHVGDSLAVLPTFGDETFSACVCDPPYGLKFMGKKWDADVPSVELWREVYRVLKPGAHLLAFFGTRTFHRGVCRIEDAGFEIRDMVAWVYGEGFPKSLDVSKAIDRATGAERIERIAARQWQGCGTALKPALEPIVVARKPLVGTVAENVLAHGTGALNIDGCRVEPGRWPANLIHDGSEEVLSIFPATASGNPAGTKSGGQGNAYGVFAGGIPVTGFGDSGSAARFFYCAKPDASERGEFNRHPTVKPVALMRYLLRMVTPPGGIVLDPFLGSGTTGVAADQEGFEWVGIERDEASAEIARRRTMERQETMFRDVETMP